MEKKNIIETVTGGLAESTRAIHKINKENITAVKADSKVNFEIATATDLGFEKFMQADGLVNKAKVVIDNIKDGAKANSEKEKVRRDETQNHSSYKTLLEEQRIKRQETINLK